MPEAGMPFRDAYAGTRVLVTGHTGFKGSWLLMWLHALGAEAAGFSLDPPSVPSAFDAMRLEDCLVAEARGPLGDVRHFERLLRFLEIRQPRIVFHLAAQALVRRSCADPRETFETNAAGTVNLLEAARRVECVEAVVVVTSDKCYAPGLNKQGEGFAEEDALGGADPYSASKAVAELAATAFRISIREAGPSYRPPRPALATARAGNVIGGGDFGEDRLVPDCIRALAADRPIGVRMPAAIRSWQFVLEPLSGYLLLGARLLEEGIRHAGPWNFGPDPADAIAAGALADRVIRAWGSGSRVSAEDGRAWQESASLRLRWDKARDRLGWRPLWRLDQAVEETVAWYKAFHAGRSATELRALALDQIRRFEQAAAAAGAWGSSR